MVSQAEQQMASVERIMEYSQLLAEPPKHVDPRPPSSWPSQGRIVVQNLSMRYRQGPLVLKKVSFEVEPGSKVGVIGRTGSGKSTIMSVLLRLVEAEQGDVQVDGLSLLSMGLADVRAALAFIPQDPVLFSGSVRYNLDPFGEYSDADVWQALERYVGVWGTGKVYLSVFCFEYLFLDLFWVESKFR